LKQEDLFRISALPKLSKLSTAFMARRFFQGGGPKDRLVYGLVINFIRLVDQAAGAYDRAHESLMKYANKHDALAWGQVINASTQLELCTGSVHRALIFADSICRHQDTPTGLRACFPKKYISFCKASRQKLRDLRHRIQHLEKDLRNGVIKDGEALMIYPDTDAAKLGNIELSYRELARCILKLHEVASQVSSFR